MIESYAFVDCLLVGFTVDNTLSTLEVITESYYPSSTDKLRTKGLIKIVCRQILFLNLEKKPEFEFDLQLPYNANGNDVKANEIYSIQCTDQIANEIKVALHADFLDFELKCTQVEIVEVNKL